MKIRRVLGLLYVKSYVGSQTFSRLSSAEVWGEGASSGAVSSSGRCSKLRGPSQNSPRVPSKRDFNVTKTKKQHYRYMAHFVFRALSCAFLHIVKKTEYAFWTPSF
ncbi:hypothetical protein AVEN_201584-1 [Araneus ventricosus]|uniref:Uncharacterized protein n=1 Tax=Araneus ventricosus TaxID=182803 RepID=A0A4Y2FEF7_ARAVE|nr:hypothetical protein AVEN_201584-1 [Araneus ventricosus]